MTEYTMKIHKAKVGYVGELLLKENKEKSKFSDNIELILIVDRSGSMYDSYPKIFNKIIPLLLEKLHYPEDKDVHFITFESHTEYRKLKKKYFLDNKENALGGTNMSGIFKELEKVLTKENLSYRILTLSDGELADSSFTSNKASEFYNKIKGKFRINSQAIRFFSSNYANPDTLGLASVIQFNSVNQATLLDINARDDESLIADQLSKLFLNDGLDIKISLLSDKNNIQSAPWESKSNEIGLIPGRNTFWLEDISQFTVKINEENPVKVNIINAEDINTENYGIILADKIKEYLSKLKILKILSNNKAQEELENMIKHFKEFENSLEVINEQELVLKDGKMSSRILYIKQLLSKRKGLISFQMDQIKNEQLLNQLNNQQKADYLRNVDNTKLGKSLAKRAMNSGELNSIIFKEINQISDNINELQDIDFSSHPSSFYSTCTTVESLQEISKLSKERLPGHRIRHGEARHGTGHHSRVAHHAPQRHRHSHQPANHIPQDTRHLHRGPKDRQRRHSTGHRGEGEHKLRPAKPPNAEDGDHKLRLRGADGHQPHQRQQLDTQRHRTRQHLRRRQQRLAAIH
jgi:hypothetical protein